MTDDTQYNPPSIDPSQRDSIFGTIQFIVDKMVMQEIDKMMPCRVIAVDRTKNRVSVQITVSMTNTARQNVIRAQVANIPIYSPSAGGFVINFPVAAGNFGWIKATDTDISLFLQTLQQSPPNTGIMHSFSSAVFYPDNMNQGVTIAGGDASNLVIQNNSGSVKVSLGSTVEITPQLGVGASPRSGAIIDAQSTSQAIGFPAMSTSQKTSIASPQAGYTVFDSTEGHLSTYNGSTWS